MASRFCHNQSETTKKLMRALGCPRGRRHGKFTVEGISDFEIGELNNIQDRVVIFALLPMRRVLLRPWFRPIIRIGATGTDEYFMDPPVATPLRQVKPDEVTVAFRARRTGELFLYVNEAVLDIPGIADVLYRNNEGSAQS